MFHKECWVRYSPGHYGYKNGVSVDFIERQHWIVSVNGKQIFASDTLAACKRFLERRYN